MAALIKSRYMTLLFLHICSVITAPIPPDQQSTYGEWVKNADGGGYTFKPAENLSTLPETDLSSYKYFPDSNVYSPSSDTPTSNFDDVVKQGLDWISIQPKANNKPTTLNGFGIVTTPNSDSFLPSKLSVPEENKPSIPTVSEGEENKKDAYREWADSALQKDGIQGITEYKWTPEGGKVTSGGQG